MSQPSRRALLRIGSGLAATVLAGCVGGESADPATRTTAESTTPATARTTSDSTPDDGETTETTEDAAELSEHVAWRTNLDGEVRLGPATLDGTLYVGAASGVLRALDPADGTELWRFDTGASFYTGTGKDYSPILADGTLYFVSGDRGGAHGDNFAAYAIDAETGAKRWSVERGFPSFLSLLGVGGGRAFVATSDDLLGGRDETLIALDVETGDEAWTAETGDATGATVTPDAAYVGSWGRLDAFDAADGTRRWTREIEDPIDPAVGDGVVYTGFTAGRETAALGLDPDSGETRWAMDDWFVTSLVADESAYVGGEVVAKFDPDGTERWRYDEGGLLADGALVGDALFASGNPVSKLSADDGTELWRYEVDADLGVVEGADERVVAIRRGNGAVLDVLDAATGENRFTFDVGGDRLRGLAVDSGTVYAGNGEGAVYALRE